MEKKNESSPARIGNCTPTSSGEKKWGFIPLGHATTAPNALASVVQRLDSAIHRINLYSVDSAISFPNTYPLDSDLSGG